MIERTHASRRDDVRMGNRPRLFARATLFLALLLVPTAPLAGQTLFSTRGLGVPVQPVDARARALGGVGTGLLGLNTSLINPAEAAGLLRRGIAATYQPTTGTAEIEGQSGDFSGARFPSIRVILPLRSQFALSLGYATAFDQGWLVESRGSLEFGDDVIETRDVIESNGDIGRLELGFAFMLRSDLAFGVSGGLYSGEVERRITRILSGGSTPVAPFGQRQRFGVEGPEVRVGLRWDPADILRLGASVAINDNLDVEVLEGPGEAQQWALPTRLTVGASGTLTPELSGAVGAEYAWGGEGAGIDPESVQRDTWRFGGGVEYTGASAGSKPMAVRLGYASEQLPFHLQDEAPASEWSLSFGLGMLLAGSSAIPLASADATFERGGRSGLDGARNPGGLSESFWRLTFTLSLFGS